MSVANAYIALSGAIDGEVRRDVRMARHTTMHVGGPAALLVCVNTLEALRRTLDVLARESVSWCVLGKGSNVLVSDDGYDGCVIQLGREFRRVVVRDDEPTIICGAAVATAAVVSAALKQGLSGIECCAGIPGTIGGAISMNAGSRREWIGAVVDSLVCLHPGEGVVRYRGSDINWAYRSTSLAPDEIVLEATLTLRPSTREEVAHDMDARLAQRRRTQPCGLASCGSVWRNPKEGSVGKMIDDCGLKGTMSGGASISDLHANFIVNRGQASAADVMDLMRQSFAAVREAYGVELEPEVKFLGFSR